jgi:flagella basal body P-ring formation protein FlgA
MKAQLLLAALLAAGLALGAAPALAADVALKSAPVSRGAAITLGDLFDGAGAVSGDVVAPAAAAGQQAVLEASQVQLAARRAGLTWDNPAGQRRVLVASLAGSRSDVASASGRGRAAAPGRRAQQALAWARNINAGELIAASDLVWSDEAVAPSDAPSDADQAIGKAARRPLRAGAAAGLRDLAAPKVIKRDEMVQVAFEEGGISLVLQAKAMADAGVGDTLNLMNPASKKILEAVCSGPGRAVVGPAAETLKTQAFDPLRLAAR